MSEKIKQIAALFFVGFWLLAACNMPASSGVEVYQPTPPAVQADPVKPSATIDPLHRLTVCMGKEPKSLFLYGDASAAARNIRQAIYEDPVELLNSASSPGMLEKIPSLAEGDVVFEPVAVQPGGVLVDAMGLT